MIKFFKNLYSRIDFLIRQTLYLDIRLKDVNEAICQINLSLDEIRGRLSEIEKKTDKITDEVMAA